jgi:hypothetical protein
MKKIAIIAAAAAALMGLTACNYFGSPEQVQFEQFLAKCKVDGSTPDCKAYADSKKQPGA